MKNNIVIIAGGKGTRIKKTLGDVPKLLAPIGNRRLIDIQIDHLKKYNFTNVHFCLGEGAQKILKYIENADINFTYTIEKTPLGTYGALLKAKPYLADSFFILYGDIATNYNIKNGFNLFAKDDSDFLLVTRHTDHPEDSDLIKIDHENYITKIFREDEVQYPYAPISCTSLMFAKKESLKEFNSFNKPDIIKHFLKVNVKNLKIKSQLSHSYIKDIGTNKRYQQELKRLEVNLKEKNKIVFLDRDGTIIKNNENNDINKFKFADGAVDLIKKLQERRFIISMVTNQPGISKGICKYEDVENLHSHLQHELIKQGVKPIDSIKYCPHHPESGHQGEIESLKRVCVCRKPSVGMVEDVLKEFNLSNKQIELLFIGDTLNDYKLSQKYNAECFIVKSPLTEIDEIDKIHNNIFDITKEIK